MYSTHTLLAQRKTDRKTDRQSALAHHDRELLMVAERCFCGPVPINYVISGIQGQDRAEKGNSEKGYKCAAYSVSPIKHPSSSSSLSLNGDEQKKGHYSGLDQQS